MDWFIRQRVMHILNSLHFKFIVSFTKNSHFIFLIYYFPNTFHQLYIFFFPLIKKKFYFSGDYSGYPCLFSETKENVTGRLEWSHNCSSSWVLSTLRILFFPLHWTCILFWIFSGILSNTFWAAAMAMTLTPSTPVGSIYQPKPSGAPKPSLSLQVQGSTLNFHVF